MKTLRIGFWDFSMSADRHCLKIEPPHCKVSNEKLTFLGEKICTNFLNEVGRLLSVELRNGFATF
jgi:hypothetical protein